MLGFVSLSWEGRREEGKVPSLFSFRENSSLIICVMLSTIIISVPSSSSCSSSSASVGTSSGVCSSSLSGISAGFVLLVKLCCSTCAVSSP